MHDNNRLDFSSLLANTVHDMKNSLTTIINTLDELTDELDAVKKDRRASSLQYESKRLNSQLIILLSLYKIENKQYYLDIDEHSLYDFLTECAVAHQELLQLNNISLDIQCPKDLVWYFDSNLLSGVISNIINNAYRYTHDRIILEASLRDDMLRIVVSDNGPGYPQEMLTSSSLTKKTVSFTTGSTGLGLYFAQRVTELHKNKKKSGYIHIDNLGINQGGRLHLYLP